jgi:type III pantothenate kinase
MTNFVALTLGNSTAAAAPVVDGRLGAVSRIDVRDLQKLSDVLAACRSDAADPAPLVVASVNPPALAALRRLAEDLHLAPPRVARDDFPIPLATAVDEPDRVGVDRLLGALAAYRRTGGPCLVLDCGTATTLNAVSADGTFLGGAIFPGPDLMARALAEGTAQLPAVEIRDTAEVIGKNTEEAIRAGVSGGWQGAVLHVLAAALAELGQVSEVFLTGGRLALVGPHVRCYVGVFAFEKNGREPHDPCQVAPNLVLEGLVIAYRESLGR